MTIFEDVLRDLLIQTNLTDRRVFLIRAPQAPNTSVRTPYMVFQPVGPMPVHSMDGPVTYLFREYQVSIFDPSQSMALGIADALRGAIDGLRGDFEGIRFGSIFFRAQTSAWQADTEIYDVVTSFQIAFRYLGTLPLAKP